MHTTEAIQIQIDSQALKAMSLFCSKDSTRPSLQGVFFDHRGKDLLLVATDGRQLGTLNLGPNETLTGQTRYLPAHALDSLKASKGAKVWVSQLTPLANYRVELVKSNFGNPAIEVPFEDPLYPDWRVAVSSNLGPRLPFTSFVVDGDYLVTFTRAAKLMNPKGTLHVGLHGYPNPASKDEVPNCLSITFDESQSFFGILMPMRLGGPVTFPIPTFPIVP